MLKKIQSFFNQNLVVSEEANHQGTVELAAAALLIELSRADFKQNLAEQQAIETALQKKFKLNPQTLATLIELAESENQEATSLYQFTKLINDHYQAEQKFKLLKALWEVAIADGEISKYEDHLIRKIADLIYAPHSDFIKSKLAVLGQ